MCFPLVARSPSPILSHAVFCLYHFNSATSPLEYRIRHTSTALKARLRRPAFSPPCWRRSPRNCGARPWAIFFCGKPMSGRAAQCGFLTNPTEAQYAQSMTTAKLAQDLPAAFSIVPAPRLSHCFHESILTRGRRFAAFSRSAVVRDRAQNTAPQNPRPEKILSTQKRK